MGGPRQYDEVLRTFQEDAAAENHPAFDLWPVMEKSTGNLVGYCGITDKEVDGSTEYELVYVFTPSVWGRGFATEMAAALVEFAFGPLGLKRIISLIEPENIASARVAQKAGLRLEKETLRPGNRRMQVYTLDVNNFHALQANRK